VVTALPSSWYPESSWRDDLSWGAAELALAGQALHDPRTAGWLEAGAAFSLGYLEYEAGAETLGVADTGAVALAEMVRAVRASPDQTDDVNEPLLLDGIRAQLDPANARATGDPFGSGVDATDFDAVARAFGLVATARLYRELTGNGSYMPFETAQLDWVLGANAWGASFLTGVGDGYPRCLHHMVANLATTADGGQPALRGAVVNGPNSESLAKDGLDDPLPGMRACPTDGDDRYAAFTGQGSRFVDDVRAWYTVEPALDMTAIATLALALIR
jgi:hypothetical protein